MVEIGDPKELQGGGHGFDWIAQVTVIPLKAQNYKIAATGKGNKPGDNKFISHGIGCDN